MFYGPVELNLFSRVSSEMLAITLIENAPKIRNFKEKGNVSFLEITISSVVQFVEDLQHLYVE